MAESFSSLRVLRPLAKPAWNSPCSRCALPQARWHVRGLPKEVFLCGPCVLYGSAWGQKNPTAVDSAVAQIEASSGRSLPRNPDGRLAAAADADDVLGVLVLTELTLRRLS